MRSYFIDELNSTEIEKIKNWLDQKNIKSALSELYWIFLPPELYSVTQQKHAQECGPYYFALEVNKHWIKFELLIRAENKIRCECITYATEEQKNYIIQFAESMLKELDITI
ncbi:MAG: hypothetical protein Q9M37_02000 [Desulfonauticus sp.]|nr:hypothetical protein [Desulfonauticus sp.]